MRIDMRAPSAFRVAARFAEEGVQVRSGTNALVRMFSGLLLTRIKANASGRPGPNAPTGDYRRSWNVRFHTTPAGLVAEVGTNKVQGRRLEYGFTGVDSLGRVYDQPPYPHVGPAVDTIEPEFVAATEAYLGKVL